MELFFKNLWGTYKKDIVRSILLEGIRVIIKILYLLFVTYLLPK